MMSTPTPNTIMIIIISIIKIRPHKAPNNHVHFPLKTRKFILTPYSSEPSKAKSGSIRQLAPGQYKPDDPNLILNMPNIRIVCDLCLKNITIICHIASEDFDYCVGCFGQLEQFPDMYTVRSTMLYSLTETDWLCLDEILLLTAFQKWGFGNWGEVKDYMNFNGTKFSKDQIEDHYDRVFLETADLNPKIDGTVIQASKIGFGKQAKRFNKFTEQPSYKKASIPELKSEQSMTTLKKANAPKNNILGYNAKRKSFYYQLQYDQKAQSMLADLEFKDDDTPQQIQLKLQIVQSYNNRLDQRLKRYEFTIEHHILDIDYRFKQEFFVNKYEKEAFLMYRPFTRFKSHEENQEIMKAIAKNNCYKSLIQGLKKCRKKIDKQGKIQSTLKYLHSKQQNAQKLGNPRKIYHVELQCDDPAETVSEQTLRKFEQSIKKTDQSQTIHNLKIIYKSTNKDP